jgi:hypothetical protein
MKAAVLKIGVNPLEVPAGVIKVAIGELAVHKYHVVQMKALPLQIFIPKCFHHHLLMFWLDIYAFVQYGYCPNCIMDTIYRKQKGPLWFNPFSI